MSTQRLFPHTCLLALLLLVGRGSSPSQAEDRSSPDLAVQRALEGRMLQDLQTLTADGFEGRGIGTKGLNLAADYVAAGFRDAGLDVTRVNGGAFQSFEVVNNSRLEGDNLLTFVPANGAARQVTFDKDFRTCSFGASTAFAGEMVFVGYGIESKDPPYNDYADLDVQGKTVVMMRRTPRQADEHGLFASAHGGSLHAALKTKISTAYAHGAKAVLFLNDPFTVKNERKKLLEQREKAQGQLTTAEKAVIGGGKAAEQELADARKHLQNLDLLISTDDPDPLVAFGFGGNRTGESLPVMHLHRSAIDPVLKAAFDRDLGQLEAEIDETSRPASRPITGWTVRGATGIRLDKSTVKNVIAVREGQGPLAEETVVVGAHYDHLGLGEEGSLSPGVKEVHNGADDNASGTVALLELARRVGRSKTPPARRLVFIAFTGEERGLLGSSHYVKEPLFPLEQTIAMINLDMVGRLQDNKLTIFGTETSPFWNPLLDTESQVTGLTLIRKPEGFGPSDHSSFYARQIPVLHLFTGTHSDYHRPTDDWEKINVPGMTRVETLLEHLVQATVATPERPAYNFVAGRAALDRSGNRPWFGSIPDFSSDAKGYALQGVVPSSPADRGGIIAGDIIVRLSNQAIGGLDDFDLALRRHSAGDDVQVIVLRKGVEVKLKVTLAKPKE